MACACGVRPAYSLTYERALTKLPLYRLALQCEPGILLTRPARAQVRLLGPASFKHSDECDRLSSSHMSCLHREASDTVLHDSFRSFGSKPAQAAGQGLRVYATTEARVTPATQFDLRLYTKQRADIVNEALDRAVPLQHPEALSEPMR